MNTRAMSADERPVGPWCGGALLKAERPHMNWPRATRNSSAPSRQTSEPPASWMSFYRDGRASVSPQKNGPLPSCRCMQPDPESTTVTSSRCSPASESLSDWTPPSISCSMVIREESRLPSERLERWISVGVAGSRTTVQAPWTWRTWGFVFTKNCEITALDIEVKRKWRLANQTASGSLLNIYAPCAPAGGWESRAVARHNQATAPIVRSIGREWGRLGSRWWVGRKGGGLYVYASTLAGLWVFPLQSEQHRFTLVPKCA